MRFLPNAAVRRHARIAWPRIVGEGVPLRMQKEAACAMHSIVQRQILELLRACACMKRETPLSRTTTSRDVHFVRHLLFSNIPSAPPGARPAASLSRNAFRRACGAEKLTMRKRASDGHATSLETTRRLVSDLVYALLVACVTRHGVVLITKEYLEEAVRALRLYDVYAF
jgi:hypothetical protein